MKPIIVTHPQTGQKTTLTTEQELRDFISGFFPFKDRRQFQVTALVQKATFGQMREVLDSFDIPYEYTS